MVSCLCGTNNGGRFWFTLKHDNSVSFWVQDKAFFYNCKFLAQNSPTTKAIAFIVGLFCSLFNKIKCAIISLFLSLAISQHFIYCIIKQPKDKKRLNFYGIAVYLEQFITTIIYWHLLWCANKRGTIVGTIWQLIKRLAY